jgi:CRP/FNR family transcriptional regulator, cyclic AMP receptor protein
MRSITARERSRNEGRWRESQHQSCAGVNCVPVRRSRSSKVDVLRRVPLFQGLSQRQLEQVARLADEVEVETGKRLAIAGETGHELFVILEGEASVKTGDGRAVKLRSGEFFGEMSLLDGGPRSSSVEADTPMKLLVVGTREFWELLHEAPPLAGKIMRTLSQRLRNAERAHTA